MANRESVEGVRGRLAIDLDSASYAPAEVVSGTVTLSILERIQSREPLAVVIQAREEVAWDDGGDSPVTNAFDKTFLQHKIVLVPTVVHEPGDYEHSFSFQLPDGLSASFELRDIYSGTIERLRLQIKYQASVWLRADSESVAFLQATQEFIMHAPPMISPPGRSLEISSTSAVHWLHCINRGSLQMVVGIPKDVFIAGEIVPISCRVDGSACKTSVSSLSVDLVEDILLRNLDNRSELSVTRVLSTQEFAGAAAGQSWDLVADILLAENEKKCPVNPAVATHFFRCTHRLIVRCKPFMAQPIETELTVRVLHNNTPSSAAVTQLQMPG